MRKRALALLTAGLLAGGGFSVAQAAPGPNGNNDHGICTAYFNGQKQGHDNRDEAPGPFGALEAQFMNDLQAIFDFCNAVDGPGNGAGGDGIGGNGGENGRFADCFTDSDGDPMTDSCTDAQPA